MEPTTVVRIRCRDDPGMPEEDAIWEVLSRRFGALANRRAIGQLLAVADGPRHAAGWVSDTRSSCSPGSRRHQDTPTPTATSR